MAKLSDEELKQKLYLGSLEVGDCWFWIKARCPKGYGYISDGEKVVQTHRLSYLLHKGALSKPMVCHTCDNPPCVNPDHLFEGTAQDNADDAIAKGRIYRPTSPNAMKTHCKNGHEFNYENTRLVKNWYREGGPPRRQCKICKRIQTRVLHLKKKQEPKKEIIGP